MIASALATLTLFAGLAFARPLEDSASAGREVERASAWPELSGRDQKQVETEVQRLRKARTEAMGSEAHDALLATGAGAAPELLSALAKEKDAEALERIQAALTAITGAEHTRLLAQEFDSKSSVVRTWCLERCAHLRDTGIVGSAQAALARVQQELAKKSTKERIAERLAAALCVTSAGALDGLAILFETASSTQSWGQHGEAIRRAVEPMRGSEASTVVIGLAKEDDREAIVAGLRLLAGCGNETAKGLVRKHLGSSDNSIRVAAINAARGIVDGDPPVDRLPVFEAVELAKRWQQKL